METWDKRYQYLLVAAEPYEVIAFKVPNMEIDKSRERFFTHWEPDKKVFTLQLHFKSGERAAGDPAGDGGYAAAAPGGMPPPPPPGALPARFAPPSGAFGMPPPPPPQGA